MLFLKLILPGRPSVLLLDMKESQVYHVEPQMVSVHLSFTKKCKIRFCKYILFNSCSFGERQSSMGLRMQALRQQPE